jgi:hypothetical protein
MLEAFRGCMKIHYLQLEGPLGSTCVAWVRRVPARLSGYPGVQAFVAFTLALVQRGGCEPFQLDTADGQASKAVPRTNER